MNEQAKDDNKPFMFELVWTGFILAFCLDYSNGGTTP